MSHAALLLSVAILTGLVIGQWPRLRALALIIVFGSILAATCYAYWWFSYAGNISTRFDSEAWKASLARDDDDDNPVRLQMVDSLLDQYHLQGMSREQIVALLGKPPETRYFKDSDFVYWLGPERGAFRIDSEWLTIRFDQTKHVREARIVRD